MKKQISILLLLLIAFAGCKTKQSGDQEVQKLLDRQAQIQESQEESVDQLRKIKDSLENEKSKLVKEREQKDQQVKQLEQNQQILADQLKDEEQTQLETERAQLEEQIESYKDSIALFKNDLTLLDAHIDSIEQSLGVYEVQEGQAEKVLESGIKEIDERITKLQNRKRQEIKNIDLLGKRIAISEKKIEAYKMERQMYVDERDELLRVNASEDELSPYLNRIAKMDSIIGSEEKNLRTLTNELNDTKQWISDVDRMINDLDEKIKMEYNKQEIVEGFIASEKVRLEKEIESLKDNRNELISIQDRITSDLTSTENQIVSLDKKMELIKNKDMSDLLEEQAAIEESDAALADEEIKLLEESAEAEKQSTKSTSSESASKDLKSILALGDQIDSLRSSIQEEKTEIVKTRKELSQKRAEAAHKRAKFGRTMAALIIALIIAGAGVLTLFYYLGKKSRKV